jgi:PAS domain S-box-containing protein
LSNINQGEFTSTHQHSKKDFELISKALDASISGIILTDNLQPDNPIIYCNAAFERMTGYTRSEIIGHNCRFLQRDDRNQEMRFVLKEAIRNGHDCCVEIRNYRKNGELFWNELYMSAIKDESGVITHFIGVQNDVSRRKKAEQELKMQQDVMEKRIAERTQILKDSEDYLASIIQTVRESLIVLDPHFNVLSANDHFLRTFKVNIEDTVGKHLYNLGNGQWNIPKLKELLVSILPTNNPVENFEVEHDFPYIGRKLMLLNAHRVELQGHYKDRILLAIEDITDRREIERRKDDFLSIASHELKTPLTTIKGYVQVLERLVPENASDKYKSVMAKTTSHIDRLNNLIAELLDVSRIQTGNIEVHRANFNFDKMVAETVEAMQLASVGPEIVIRGSIGMDYYGDEAHIVQVITNLLSNAIKYAPDSSEIVIHLSLVSDYIKVSVMDSGMGISYEDQKRIFERFFRVGEIQQRFPGMGIGLYLCDQIVKNHGGTLWVDSEKGQGSTFSFTLPLNKEGNDE